MPDLTLRQEREIAYHREYAERSSELPKTPVAMDVFSGERRWWNAFWESYRLLCHSELAGKKIMVPGCGFGDDAIRIAMLGADVYTFDLSDDIVTIARERAEKHGVFIHFAAMPAEALNYEDNFFDGAFFVDILHHVDIGRAMKEAKRVLKPGGFIVGNELYTYSRLQRVRDSGLVSRFLYPRMVKFIYGTARPYITSDERKVDERELATICDHLRRNSLTLFCFLLFSGRVFPGRFRLLTRLDNILLRAIGPFGRFFCGRIVFAGTII